MKLKITFNDKKQKIVDGVEAYEYRGDVAEIIIENGKYLLLDEVNKVEIVNA